MLTPLSRRTKSLTAFALLALVMGGCALPQGAAVKVASLGYESTTNLSAESIVIDRTLPGGGHDHVEIRGLNRDAAAVNASMAPVWMAALAAQAEALKVVAAKVPALGGVQ